ncbi:hypothetical protein V493_07681, partial [Pseudogymnoascus sp. VKM F-4281 (FW-2241)]
GLGVDERTIAAVIADGAGRGGLAGGEEALGAPGPGGRDVGHVFRLWRVLGGAAELGLVSGVC